MNKLKNYQKHTDYGSTRILEGKFRVPGSDSMVRIYKMTITEFKNDIQVLDICDYETEAPVIRIEEAYSRRKLECNSAHAEFEYSTPVKRMLCVFKSTFCTLTKSHAVLQKLKNPKPKQGLSHPKLQETVDADIYEIKN